MVFESCSKYKPMAKCRRKSGPAATAIHPETEASIVIAEKG